MKTKMRWRFLPILAGLITFAAFVGSISGSLAWWAYSTRVSVQYQGTSVATSVQLQIGLKVENFSESDVEELTDLGMIEDRHLASGNTRYVFSKAGAGLPENTIATYLRLQGDYSINTLYPVTSRQYKIGDQLKLYQPLMYGLEDNRNLTDKNRYVKIPFVFRVITVNDTTPVKNQYVWLTHVNLETSSPESHISEAMRLYMDSGTNKFVINPSDTSTNEIEATKVHGLLDLNKDGYFDQDGSGKEIVYGQFTGNPIDTFTPTSDAFANINNVSDTSHQTSFYSKHQANKLCYNSLSGIDTSDGMNGLAQYRPLGYIIPTDTPNGYTEYEKAICQTANDDNALAEVDMTIYLEGWDHSVVDEELGYGFNLGLQFQINFVS